MTDIYMIDRSWESGAENLAYEYCLMDRLIRGGSHEKILYLWQNRDTVVIGRNQSPYKECDMNFLKSEGIELVRRTTGGGAVYHDLGNLNYSFLCHKKYYDREKIFASVIEALDSLGVSCRLSGRNDILAGGLKVSGNAFYEKDGVVLHHGTVMVHVDTGRMKACLTPSKAKLSSKGIRSVEGRVGNLADIRAGIDIRKVKYAFFSAFGGGLDAIGGELAIDEGLFRKTVHKFSSEEWIYGDYPENYETVSGSFEWGNVVLGVSIEGNRIEQCYVESDSLYPDEINAFEEHMKGMALTELSNKENNGQTDGSGGIKRKIREDMLCLIRKNLINQ